MSTLNAISQVKKALRNLNPAEVRRESARDLNIALVANSHEDLWKIERYLCPPELSEARRAQVSRMLRRVSPGGRGSGYDLEIWDQSLSHPEGVFIFDAANPERTVADVLNRRFDLALPLARNFPPFRKPVIDTMIHSVSKENALFALATALPDIVPLLSLPWALGEFASDSAFLTMNQIRMAFMIAAASDVAVGYREQRSEIGSIVAGAFGFRAIARVLVSKIPLGGGLIPKAAIAWSGTWVVGRSMERLYSLGYAYSREERRSVFAQVLEKGREVATSLLRRPEAA